AAAKTYFGKPIEDLTVGEAALIAGLVPAPSRYTPFRNMKAAQTRQHFVLRRMMEEGYLTAEQRASALEEPIVLVERKSQELRKVAAYFAEEVRRYLVERFGPEEVLTGGLQVWTTLNPDNQRAAYEAVREGLRAHDRRRGYRGPVRSIPVDIWGEFLPELSEANGEPPWPDGKRMYGLVVEIDMEENQATLALGSGVETVLRLEDVDWAREPDASVDGLAAKIRHIQTALKPGYLVNLEKTGERLIAPKPISEEVLEGEEEVEEGERMSLPRLVPRVALYQEPRAEGALLSMETSSGHVPAMIGGYSFGRSQFNRAVQGRRQPGSAFKPIIYAAALEAGYTPATIVYDTPIVWKDLETGALWKPGNYSQRFYGPITLRAALARSRNIATIKILRDVGVRRVIEMARTLGIRSPLARDLSLALGSSEVTLTELVRAYATFPSGGRLIDPIFILEVRSRDGELLEENVSLFADELEPEVPTAGPRQPTSELERILAQIRESVEPGDGPDDDAGFIPDAEHVLDPVTAYLMSNMLEAVVQEGTGWRVKALKRPVGGKTGTTNDMFDAWFFGSSPQLVTGVWVGYDSPRNLGKNEAGSRAAGPIFVQYMREALKSLPPLDFEVPPGIEFWRIDRQTGLLASSTTKEAVFQPFREGTAPTEITRTGHTTGPSTPPRLD
ncbi:MAG: penicillin-binding transpeptidase domain-containing protein, partial [Myxococcota bacterium]